MQKKVLIFPVVAVLAVILTLVGCKHQGPMASGEEEESLAQEKVEIKGDSMLYGLSCDGSSDSVIVIWPFGGEPITYSCIEAKRKGRIIGKPQIGDWVGVMVNAEDTAEVTFVINLDQLKGTWTYPVLPVMKDLQNMSKRMQHRMMENMSDSIRNAYFIPREYGFSLKRGHDAQAVGRIMRTTTLEDDSPVEYPKVKNYRKWFTLNGRLILYSSDRPRLVASQEDTKKYESEFDTLDFVYMDDDSLILLNHGVRMGFHRKENAIKANAVASKAQQKQDDKKLK